MVSDVKESTGRRRHPSTVCCIFVYETVKSFVGFWRLPVAYSLLGIDLREEFPLLGVSLR